MPITEVTVFKDGHAFVLHKGKMPTDADGNVILDYLPQPIIGTFWPYSADTKTPLVSVTAGQRKTVIQRTALNIREMIESNVGAQVVVTECSPSGSGKESPISYPATIASVPTQTGEEIEETSGPNPGERLSQKGAVVLLKTENGTKLVNFDRIQDITFKGEYKTLLPREEFRNYLTLKLDWAGRKPDREAQIGMAYLQKGIRWIPGYRINIDGDGNASVMMQATLLNEMIDLEDATINMVVGVPSFAFKETIDPVSLQQTVAQLSRYFQSGVDSQYAFSNAIMTQSARMAEHRNPAPPAAAPDAGLDVAGSGKNEDTFIYTVRHVTLKKGERMVLPVAQFPLKYKDVYSLEIPVAPPVEVRRHLGGAQQTELARLLNAPKAKHRIRLSNSSAFPLTTAPATILRKENILCQSMMTYTAIGGSLDLDITTAIDIAVKKTEKEVKRTPSAAVWQGDQYARVDLAGSITLTQYGKQSVEIEVVRHVLGNVDSCDHDGKIEMVNVQEDYAALPDGGDYPYWWGWYSWQYWWYHFNSIGRVKWTVTLTPGKPVDLNYAWNYYWR